MARKSGRRSGRAVGSGKSGRSGKAVRSARTSGKAGRQEPQSVGGRESQRRTSKDTGRREASRRPSGRRQQGSQQTVMIVGGAIGAVVLIVGCVIVMGSGSTPKPPAPATVDGRMSPEEARRLKREGGAELAKGESLYRQAGAFGSPGFAAKINQARGHLNTAMDTFNRIPDCLSDQALESLATQCGRLLSACFKVPIDMR